MPRRSIEAAPPVDKISRGEIAEHADALSFIAEQDRIVDQLLEIETDAGALGRALFGDAITRYVDGEFIRIVDEMKPAMVLTNGEESAADTRTNRAIMDLRGLFLVQNNPTNEPRSEYLSLEASIHEEAVRPKFNIICTPATIFNLETTEKHPNNSQTNTSEWSSTPFLKDDGTDSGRRLVVGRAVCGGAVGVDRDSRGDRWGDQGFRLSVVFDP